MKPVSHIKKLLNADWQLTKKRRVDYFHFVCLHESVFLILQTVVMTTIFSKLPNEVLEIILRQLKLKCLTRFASTNRENLARVCEIIWDNKSTSNRVAGRLTIRSGSLTGFQQEKVSQTVNCEHHLLELYHNCIENNQSPALVVPFSVGIRFTPAKSPLLDSVMLPTLPVQSIRVFNEEDLLRILRLILQTFW